LTPFGDRAARFVIPNPSHAGELLERLRAIDGVRDVVLTEEIGCVVFDDAKRKAEPEVAAVLAAPPAEDEARESSQTHAIQVVYDGDDLDAVAAAIGKTREHVVALHSEAEYRVAMIGFLPGFAYLRGLPEVLRLPRRAPRPRVPKNSVAIAAEYSGIYPFASPGGWHLLGRAIDFEAFGATGAAMSIGDAVRFVPAEVRDVAPARRDDAEHVVPSGPHLEIVRAAGFALLVDGGRFGHMHEGVPPGGPLVRRAFDRANALVGNAAGCCAVEVFGTLEVSARMGSVTISDGSGRIELAEGQSHVVSTVGTPERVRYLALAGGVDAPLVLGSRSALVLASIGHPLRKRELLGSGSGTGTGTGTFTCAGDGSEIVVDVLASGWDHHAYRVSASSDRTGTRLDGPAIDFGSPDRRSTPMVIGAIELTPAGLIVLGPDHPTTGGYPVVGVVRSTSLDALFSKKPGDEVRFVRG
jgi:KipI family sensor histidine kinase inhibitor